MTVTMTEMFLFGCNLVTLVLYLAVRQKLSVYVGMTAAVFEGIADNKVKVVRKKSGGVELMVTNNVRGE